MRDYWLTKELLQVVSIGFWLIALIGVGLALSLPKQWWGKLLAVAFVGCLISIPLYKSRQEGQQQQELVDLRKERLIAAKDLFEEHCRTVGEKVYKTVEKVDGVVWMKWRTEAMHQGQFSLSDPYGADCSMEGCILRLLRGDRVGQEWNSKTLPDLSYKFVETIDPADGIRYRYTGQLKAIADVPKEQWEHHVKSTGYGADSAGRFFALQRQPIDQFSARFGISWDDVSTPEDREYWIAGGALTVMDLKTNEVIAKRLGYLIDFPGLGDTGGFRDPWGWAQSNAPKCPQRISTVDFATRVLIPTPRPL